MNTKEAIEWVEKITWTKYSDHSPEVFDKYKDSQAFRIDRNKIIELLQRGEKYKQMWKEARDYFQNDLDLDEYMEELEQKYFPDLICGTCGTYNSDTLFCSEHPEYGELVEQDTCSDWSEDDTIPK